MAAIDTISSRQHLASSDMHKAEITAAATVMHRLMPARAVPADLGSHRHADLDGSMSLAMAGAEVRPLHVVHGAGAEVHGRGNDCALGGASRCGCAERR